MSTDPRPSLLGVIGTAATFSLTSINDVLGFLCGVLSLAYLVRQHLAFRSEKKDK